MFVIHFLTVMCQARIYYICVSSKSQLAYIFLSCKRTTFNNNRAINSPRETAVDLF